MSDASCSSSRCERPAPGAYLCNACTEQLRRDLGDIASGIVDELETSYLRQARFSSTGGKRSSDEQPLPYDDRASDAKATEVRRIVLLWAGRIAAERQVMLPASLSGCGRLLLEHVNWWRAQSFAGEAYDQLHRVIQAVLHVVDVPASQSFIGVCPGNWPEEDACGTPLYGQATSSQFKCPTCALYWPRDKLRSYFVTIARDHLATAIECSRAIERITDDLKVTPERIRKWKERGRLEVRGYDRQVTPEGRVVLRPLYRLGDVEDRLREDAVAAARREAKRERRAG